jgi:hypothetical protein
LGGRGNDDFLVSGYLAHHSEAESGHYHITVSAVRVPKAVRRDKNLASVEHFFAAVARGTTGDGTSIRVLAQHRFPRALWKGMKLPVPLPPPISRDDAPAELTGIEVSYKRPEREERILVSGSGDDFRVVTVFRYTERVTADLFFKAVQLSVEIAGRLFQRPMTDE